MERSTWVLHCRLGLEQLRTGLGWSFDVGFIVSRGGFTAGSMGGGGGGANLPGCCVGLALNNMDG